MLNERKIKPPVITYADFESVLMPEANGKQNLEEFYTNKHQKHIAWSYGYKLLCVNDKLVSILRHIQLMMLFTISLIV